MLEIRKEILNATAELKRLQSNGKLTRKEKRNRKYLPRNTAVLSCTSDRICWKTESYIEAMGTQAQMKDEFG